MRALKPPKCNYVLLCNRTRPPGAAKHSCGDHGADGLRSWLKAQLKAEGLWGDSVKVVPVDCLDICPAQGVVMGFSGGRQLLLVDAELDREELLQTIREEARRDL